MKQLRKGGNALLAKSGEVKITLQWQETAFEVDGLCFGLADDDRVLSDK